MKLLLIFGLIYQLGDCAGVYTHYLQKYVCKLSDPEYDACLLRKFKNILPFYVKGIPELDVPQIDPYQLSEYSLNNSIFGMGGLEVNFKDCEVTGLRNTIFHAVRADVQNKSVEMSFTIPWMNIKMHYNLSGHFMLIPIKVEGDIKGNITDIQVILKYTLHTYIKDGVDYYKMDQINPKISIGGGNINISTTNKELEATVKSLAELFNQNPRGFFNLVLPFLVKHNIDFLRKNGDTFFAALPVSEWASR